jgi:transketolase N-terminal domain/subunit
MTDAVSTSQLANAIRALAMDAVEAAKSGHPGMPMGMAEIAVALWQRHLVFNPAIRSGRIAIASSSPMVTARCCCTRCCI